MSYHEGINRIRTAEESKNAFELLKQFSKTGDYLEVQIYNRDIRTSWIASFNIPTNTSNDDWNIVKETIENNIGSANFMGIKSPIVPSSMGFLCFPSTLRKEPEIDESGLKFAFDHTRITKH